MAARHSPCVLHGSGPCQAALPRPHEELAAACQPVSHLERTPAAAQTFQRGHPDANPAQGLGNGLQAAPWSERITMFFPSLSAFFKLLNPSRSLVHSSGALTLAFEAPRANNENDEADQAGLLLCPVLSWVRPPLHLCSGWSAPPETG